MDVKPNSYDEQKALWNGPGGLAWVEAQASLDEILKPFQEILLAEVAAEGRVTSVLDVGCGTGSTTIALARLLGATGRCAGIDISEPMIAAAKVRAERDGASAEFILADAESYAFEPARFDMIVSRFGVMFFGDPVRAFANLRRAARGGLRFVAWRSPAENPFMIAAERAAAPFLPNLPPRLPDAPGQFAFAERERIAAILAGSGWSGIDIRPVDVVCAFPESELIPYLTRLGPVGRAMEGVDDATRVKIIEAARAAFAPFVRDDEVRFMAACWLVGAQP